MAAKHHIKTEHTPRPKTKRRFYKKGRRHMRKVGPKAKPV